MEQSDIKQILDTLTECYHKKDSSLLEPKEGFFFGSTEVNEYYWECVADSIDSLIQLSTKVTPSTLSSCSMVTESVYFFSKYFEPIFIF